MAKKIFRGLGKVISSPLVLGGGLLGALGSKKKSAPAPEPEKPVMPLPDDEAVRRARRRSMMQQQGRSGRSSTILSTDSDTLGG